MPSEQQLADYLAGTLPDAERVALEAGLAADPERLREVVRQRSLDAALGALLTPNSAPIEAAIMASVRGASDETLEARVLAATVRRPPIPSWRNPLASIGDWLSAGTRWRWAGVGSAALLLGVAVGVLWLTSRTPSTDRSRLASERANANDHPELLRDLAPLVAAPPVWTGSEQQTAWVTALAAVTAPGEQKR